MRFMSAALAACAFALVLAGCNFHEPRGDAEGGAGDATRGGATAGTWAVLEAQLFGPNCDSCHNPGRSAGGVDLTSYNAVTEGIVGPDVILEMIASKAMPPSGAGVDPAMETLLGCWIDAGAPKTGVVPCD